MSTIDYPQQRNRTFIDRKIPASATAIGEVIAYNYDNALKEMYSISLYQTQVYQDAIKKRFLKLRDIWKDESKFYSDPNAISSNRHYQKIIEMGYEVLPFIIEDLRVTYSFWFAALEKITGINPIRRENLGNIKAMTQDWSNWYKKAFEF